jgi:hypothetical protein
VIAVRHAPPQSRGLEREDRAQEGQEDRRGDVVVGDGDVEDEEHDQDDREGGSRPDPGRGVDVRPSAALRVIVVTLIAHAGAFDRSTQIDEWREHSSVEEEAGDDAREEGDDEIDLAHRALVRLTARTYPRSRQAGEPGSRCGSDQRAVMPASVRAPGRGFYSADWAVPASGPPGAIRPIRENGARAPDRSPTLRPASR